MEPKFAIDVSNVLFPAGASGVPAKLSRLAVLEAALHEEFGGAARIRSVIDATTSGKIQSQSSNAAEFHAMLRNERVTQASRTADPILLEMARRDGFVIVSNDLYREYNTKGVVLLPFTIVDGRAYFDPADVESVRKKAVWGKSASPGTSPAMEAPPPSNPKPLAHSPPSNEPLLPSDPTAVVEFVRCLSEILKVNADPMDFGVLANAIDDDENVRRIAEQAVPPPRRDRWLSRFVKSHPTIFQVISVDNRGLVKLTSAAGSTGEEAAGTATSPTTPRPSQGSPPHPNPPPVLMSPQDKENAVDSSVIAPALKAPPASPVTIMSPIPLSSAADGRRLDALAARVVEIVQANGGTLSLSTLGSMLRRSQAPPGASGEPQVKLAPFLRTRGDLFELEEPSTSGGNRVVRLRRNGPPRNKLTVPVDGHPGLPKDRTGGASSNRAEGPRAPTPPVLPPVQAEPPPSSEPPAHRCAVSSGGDAYGYFMTFVVGEVVQKVRWVASSRFVMGSPPKEFGRDPWEAPYREVFLSRGFWIGETAVTQQLWKVVMAENPSRFQSDDRPVERVNWYACRSFLTKLNGLLPGLGARLPTEAEWECACRAKTRTATWLGSSTTAEEAAKMLDQVAWHRGNSATEFDLPDGHDMASLAGTGFGGTHPVARKAPNPWGLFDMLGNVYEWCEDTFRPYNPMDLVDPCVVTKGAPRMVRGGAWDERPQCIRAALRIARHPSEAAANTGFRIVLDAMSM